MEVPCHFGKNESGVAGGFFDGSIPLGECFYSGLVHLLVGFQFKEGLGHHVSIVEFIHNVLYPFKGFDSSPGGFHGLFLIHTFGVVLVHVVVDFVFHLLMGNIVELPGVWSVAVGFVESLLPSRILGNADHGVAVKGYHVHAFFAGVFII